MVNYHEAKVEVSAKVKMEQKKKLRTLLKHPDNRYCADCPAKNPKWASINLGIFVCLNCAGIHRDMGVHVSKVRSVDLDTWQEAWVQNMEKWGNRRANENYEAKISKVGNVLDGIKPSEADSQALNEKVKSFIRNKYEKKKWYESAPKKDTSFELKPIKPLEGSKSFAHPTKSKDDGDDLFDLLDLKTEIHNVSKEKQDPDSAFDFLNVPTSTKVNSSPTVLNGNSTFIRASAPKADPFACLLE
eukprot:augustus_masked-scaffold_36-processed-gene-1.7-mRNA-1 protein AED:0.14 eAED:0.14 QI:0/-1/0/1/-1/1/1/0/243